MYKISQIWKQLELEGQSNTRKVKNQVHVHDRARIKTMEGLTARKQTRVKDLGDLEDRFGSGSQVASPQVTL